MPHGVVNITATFTKKHFCCGTKIQKARLQGTDTHTLFQTLDSHVLHIGILAKPQSNKTNRSVFRATKRPPKRCRFSASALEANQRHAQPGDFRCVPKVGPNKGAWKWPSNWSLFCLPSRANVFCFCDHICSAM